MWARCIERREHTNPPQWQLNYINALFDIYDTSQDSSIDMEEYTNIQMSFGLSMGNCEMAFNKFAPVNSKTKRKYRPLHTQQLQAHVAYHRHRNDNVSPASRVIIVYFQGGHVDRSEFRTIMLQYYYSNNVDDPGNYVFGMLPDDVATELTANPNDESTAAEDDD